MKEYNKAVPSPRGLRYADDRGYRRPTQQGPPPPGAGMETRGLLRSAAAAVGSQPQLCLANRFSRGHTYTSGHQSEFKFRLAQTNEHTFGAHLVHKLGPTI